MLKYVGGAVHAALYHIILGAWRTETALADFEHGVVIQSQEKGDSTDCDAYCTIVFQSLAGKAYSDSYWHAS